MALGRLLKNQWFLALFLLAIISFGTTVFGIASGRFTSGPNKHPIPSPSKIGSNNLPTRAEPSSLILASQNGHLEAVQALLAKGADINAKTNHGSTALTVAKDVEVRALLIRAGAKPGQ